MSAAPSPGPALAPSDVPLADPRGLRVAAGLTGLVLAVVLVTGWAWLLAAQAVVFALGTADRSPYGAVFRRFVRPRLGPPVALEDARPPRFAQGLGLTFAVLGVVGFLAGSSLLAFTATAAALVAAVLNAAFGICLGCELYLLFRRTSIRRARAQRTVASRADARHEEVSA